MTDKPKPVTVIHTGNPNNTIQNGDVDERRMTDCSADMIPLSYIIVMRIPFL